MPARYNHSRMITAMRASACVRLEVPLEARVKLLTEDYAHFLHNPETINSLLAHLVPLRGSETVTAWQELANKQAWDQLVSILLLQHYDPAYLKSLATNYAAAPTDLAFATADLSASGLSRLAQDILKTDAHI